MAVASERLQVRDFMQVSNQLSRTMFVTKHPDPILVRATKDPFDGYGAHQGFMTRVGPSPLERAAEASVAKPNQVVLEIRKRPGSPFEERIGVGRTRNTDVHVADHGVSKYHAYFSLKVGTSIWQITDAGSKNGTFVNGRRLGARETIELKSGVQVAFGAANFRFFTPEGFYDYLKDPNA